MAVYTYDPSQVSLTLCGYRLTGVKSISVQLDNPTFKIVRGLRGTVTRVRDKSTSASITVSVNQQSMANSILSELHRLDTQYGTGRIELVLKDLGGESLIESDVAYVEGYPEFSFSEDAGTRNWKIQCLTTRSLKVGSNFKPSIDLF